MKLTYFQGREPNFGDELNSFMWNELLPPGFLDDDSSNLFVGIGSILTDEYPSSPRKYVFGSGYGGYTAAPDVFDGTWHVSWVRGPQTAKRLGLCPSLAITDAAVLLRETDLPPPAHHVGAAFMPHFESVDRGNWSQVCELAGVTYLDPRRDPRELISQIRGASVVVTEAMHGAIVADALRTPFIAVTPLHVSHRYKWEDWSQSVGLSLEFVGTMPSSILEIYVNRTGLHGKGTRSNRLLKSQALLPLNKVVMERAARQLRKIVCEARPQLSSESKIIECTERSLLALNKFVKSWRAKSGI